MKYFFGINNNFLEIDKYNRVNIQSQFFLQNGYEFHNGRIMKPEKKEFYAKDMPYPVVGLGNIPGIPIVIEKSGWYCPSNLIGTDYFVHMGILKKKEIIDWTGYVTSMHFDSPIKDSDGNICYTLQPKYFHGYVKTNIFTEGIGAIKINKNTYDNHNFLLSNFHAMHSLENFYRLYIFERPKDV